MKGAHQILSRGNVDPGLAADRAIDLGEQARRHLHEIAAAIDDGCGEACKIADDSAAERNDVIFPLDTMREQCIDDRLQPRPALALLARRNEDRNRADFS